MSVTVFTNQDGKKRYRVTCEHCGYVVVRSSRESADHNMALHVNYTHEGKA